MGPWGERLGWFCFLCGIPPKKKKEKKFRDPRSVPPASSVNVGLSLCEARPPPPPADRPLQSPLALLLQNANCYKKHPDDS